MSPSQGSSADALSAVGGIGAARSGLGWELQTAAAVSTAGAPREVGGTRPLRTNRGRPVGTRPLPPRPLGSARGRAVSPPPRLGLPPAPPSPAAAAAHSAAAQRRRSSSGRSAERDRRGAASPPAAHRRRLRAGPRAAARRRRTFPRSPPGTNPLSAARSRLGRDVPRQELSAGEGPPPAPKLFARPRSGGDPAPMEPGRAGGAGGAAPCASRPLP